MILFLFLLFFEFIMANNKEDSEKDLSEQEYSDSESYESDDSSQNSYEEDGFVVKDEEQSDVSSVDSWKKTKNKKKEAFMVKD